MCFNTRIDFENVLSAPLYFGFVGDLISKS
nr:MAG TPA: hypothetical protein [Caudoviricetes sp.]